MKTQHPIPSDSIRSITEWHQLARPEPDAKALAVQLGCHIEEFVEMLDALGARDHLLPDRSVWTWTLEALADDLKSGRATITPMCNTYRKALLDSLCDQVVTAIGVAHCAGMDFPPALAEVNRSNWSKFENGAPVFLPGGKIGKGEFYTPPNLTDFV